MPVSPNVRARGKGRKPKAPSAGTPNPANVRPEPETTRASLYDEVTGRIIAELEAGRFPWVQPWGRPDEGGGKAGPGLPRNALTARHYSGVNVLILWGAVIEHGYPSQTWLTFKQARQAGGCVRKGERGTTVVYADRFTPRDRKQEALPGERLLRSRREGSRRRNRRGRRRSGIASGERYPPSQDHSLPETLYRVQCRAV